MKMVLNEAKESPQNKESPPIRLGLEDSSQDQPQGAPRLYDVVRELSKQRRNASERSLFIFKEHNLVRRFAKYVTDSRYPFPRTHSKANAVNVAKSAQYVHVFRVFLPSNIKSCKDHCRITCTL